MIAIIWTRTFTNVLRSTSSSRAMIRKSCRSSPWQPVSSQTGLYCSYFGRNHQARKPSHAYSLASRRSRILWSRSRNQKCQLRHKRSRWLCHPHKSSRCLFRNRRQNWSLTTRFRIWKLCQFIWDHWLEESSSNKSKSAYRRKSQIFRRKCASRWDSRKWGMRKWLTSSSNNKKKCRHICMRLLRCQGIIQISIITPQATCIQHTDHNSTIPRVWGIRHL